MRWLKVGLDSCHRALGSNLITLLSYLPFRSIWSITFDRDVAEQRSLCQNWLELNFKHFSVKYKTIWGNQFRSYRRPY
jgi:hypothetical protein